MVTSLGTIALVWLVAAMTPGPNFLVVVRAALAGNRGIAAATAAGTVVGTFAWGIAGWLGISAMFAAAPTLYQAIQVIGGAYIVYLGVRQLVTAHRRAAATPQAAPTSRLAGFRQGLATNLSNPKTVALVASLFAAALPEDPPPFAGLVVACTMAAVSASWYTVLVTAISTPRVARAYIGARRWIDTVTGCIFVAFGVTMALAR